MSSRSSLLNRRFHRSAPASRADGHSFLDIRRRFHFRAITLGRWVTDEEKARAASLFYDALCDLMTILGGPEALVSLRGSLALQYGTGGRRGVAAHYEPATHTFALAKNAGPGSIAHEWFHAFDHYIGGHAFSDAPGQFGSKAWVADATPVVHPLNDLLCACYRSVLVSESGKGPSLLFERSAARDRELGTLYYALPEEMCARAFESFVQDSPIKNSFLVSGTKESEEATLGLYPHGEQRERINRAFGDYFSQLGKALRRTASAQQTRIDNRSTHV